MDIENELLPEIRHKDNGAEKYKDNTQLKGEELEEYILAGKIIHCRVLGMEYKEISDALSVPEYRVKNVLAQNLHELSPVENKEALRGLQLKRDEQLLKPQMIEGIEGDEKATRVAISIMNGINSITDLYRPVQNAEISSEMQDMLETALRIVEESSFTVGDIIDAEVVSEELMEATSATPFIERQLEELARNAERRQAEDDE